MLSCHYVIKSSCHYVITRHRRETQLIKKIVVRFYRKRVRLDWNEQFDCSQGNIVYFHLEDLEVYNTSNNYHNKKINIMSLSQEHTYANNFFFFSCLPVYVSVLVYLSVLVYCILVHLSGSSYIW